MKRKLVILLSIAFALICSMQMLACGGPNEVKFNSGCDTIEISSQSVKNGAKIQVPEEPTRAGYTFDGWYLDDEKWDFDNDTVNSSIELTAKWTIIVYTITYELNGGINDKDNPTTYTVEDEIILKNPTTTNNPFLGWKVNGKSHTGKIEKGTTGDIAFVATWDEGTPFYPPSGF